MPSWNRRRLDKQSEKDLKRRTVIDSDLKHDKEGERSAEYVDDARLEESFPTRARDDSITSSPRRNRRLRDSVVSLSAVGDSPIHVNRPVPVLEAPEVNNNQPTPKPRRFSMMKFRHASDSQISKTAKEHADATSVPPLPVAPPSIITTAPTMENFEVQKRKSAFLLPRKNKTVPKKKSQLSLHGNAMEEATPETPTPSPSQRVTFDESTKLRATSSVPHAPPPYGDESSSALALPISRMSESSRSDGSYGDHGVFATTTTTHTVSTTTTFFRLPRRKRDKGPLFPLPPKVNSANPSTSNTPRLSTGRNSESPSRTHFNVPSENSSMRGSPRRSDQCSPARHTPRTGPDVFRSDSRASVHSQSSAFGRPSVMDQRGRSSTMSSLRRALEDEPLPAPPVPHSTRTSTSTAGRPSFGGLFSLSRLKQSSEVALHRGLGTSGPGTPGSFESKQNSFNLPREPPVVIPERQEGDTPAKYLARLEEVVNRGALVTLLSKSDDEFTKNVMRSFMRRFKFFEDPLDMAVRKLLMQVELPKETQHIDRTLQSFADRYHECNPGIFASPDDAYFVAFSILILHTDFFNKNNKHKMQKPDYIKNTRSQGGIATEILECFYDNTSYTPFIHVEDDVDMTAERIVAQKSSRKGGLKASGTPSLKRNHNGPVDPYTLILDSQLDTLRPPLDDVLSLEDCFHYLCPGGSINIADLNRTFFKSGVLQIVSARSRPGAFANQATMSNPSESQVGVVDMKITKVGIIWRKDQKKKKARSPWQEWGAVLTGSQLYLFKNTSWVKNLMHQYDHHLRTGRSNTPVVFKPPLEQLKPDFLVSMEEAVALVDSRYKKHKHAFIFARKNVYSEVFLADNEADMKDWLAKLNYAATFRTAGVRMRGVVGNSHEPRKSRETRRSHSIASTDSANGRNFDGLTQSNKAVDELSRQIMVARRQIMAQKISESDVKIASVEQQLDGLLRTARHVRVLTPIQAKTKDEVVVAAVRLANNIRWSQIEKWRMQCHRDILSLDLEEDLNHQKGESSETTEREKEKEDTTHQTTKESSQSRLGFGRLASKTNSSTSQGGSKHRPGSQPTGTKIFSMDDIFRTPARLKAQHYRPKGSWEIPPLNFDRQMSQSANRGLRKADSKSSESKVSEDTAVIDPETSGDEAAEATVAKAADPNEASKLELKRASSELIATPAGAIIEQDEHEFLVQAGIVTPSPRGKGKEKEKDLAKSKDITEDSDDDTVKAIDLSDKEGLSKVRHSFQRKLQGAHGASHQIHQHRSSKKGGRPISGSSSNAAASGAAAAGNPPTDDETNPSGNESEGAGLMRAPGSFTVHGKKASIITFGDEWHAMPPEEHLKLHRLPTESSRGVSEADNADGSRENATLKASAERTAADVGKFEQIKDTPLAAGLGLTGIGDSDEGAEHSNRNGLVAGANANTEVMLAARGKADQDAQDEAEKVDVDRVETETEAEEEGYKTAEEEGAPLSPASAFSLTSSISPTTVVWREAIERA